MSAGDPRDRILTAAEVIRRFGPPRGRTLVFTNGCFDLLHAGHVSLLSRARRLGDRLVVAVNSDASVRRLKGEGRPIQKVEERAYVVAGLRSVDAVTVFEEDTPRALIAALRPEILVKGAEYRAEDIPGAELLPAWGGRLCLLEHVEGGSTTELIRRIRRGAPG